jgi:hypothetical protein
MATAEPVSTGTTTRSRGSTASTLLVSGSSPYQLSTIDGSKLRLGRHHDASASRVRCCSPPRPGIDAFDTACSST